MERECSKVRKTLAAIGFAIVATVSSASAQGVCLGLNCPGLQDDVFNGFPTQYNSWGQYSSVLGVYTGLEIPPESDFPTCTMFCVELGAKTEDACTSQLQEQMTTSKLDDALPYSMQDPSDPEVIINVPLVTTINRCVTAGDNAQQICQFNCEGRPFPDGN